MEHSQSERFRLLMYEWDIDVLRSVADQATAGTIDVSSAATQIMRVQSDDLVSGGVSVDWSYVANLPSDALSRPVFVASIPTGPGVIRQLVDGWHRVALAERLSIPRLPAVFFDVPLSRQALTNRSATYPDAPPFMA